MTFGLKDETIAKIQSAFIKYPEVEKVVIYDSISSESLKEHIDRVGLVFYEKDAN